MNSANDSGGGRYGSVELKKLVGPNLLRGLAVAVLLHGMAGASPLVYQMFFGVYTLKEVDIEIPLPPSKVVPPPQRDRPLRYIPVVPGNFANLKKKHVIIPVEPGVKEDTVISLSSPGIPDPSLPLDSLFTGSVNGGGISGSGDFGSLEDVIPPMDSFIVREIDPQPLSDNPQPAYPELAKLTGLNGKVVVRVYVDTRGDVKKFVFEQVNPVNLGFDDEVAKVIEKWKFTPAIQQDKPVGVWVSVPFRFKIGK